MKDYSVTITLSVSIQARNDEQAEERGQMVADSIKVLPEGKQPAWWPDVDDVAVEVTEA